jgi:hypothetical protein
VLDGGLIVSDLPKLPMWAVRSTEDGFVYENEDSQGRVWRMWRVTAPAPGDPFPEGWRFAPVDALDQIQFVKFGGLRELGWITEGGFRHHLGLPPAEEQS